MCVCVCVRKMKRNWMTNVIVLYDFTYILYSWLPLLLSRRPFGELTLSAKFRRELYCYIYVFGFREGFDNYTSERSKECSIVCSF